MKRLFKKDNNKGFTLMEMIIVIAIIAILIALVAPNLISYLNTATDTKVAGNAKTCYTSANAWVAQLKIDGKSAPAGKTIVISNGSTKASVAISWDSYSGDDTIKKKLTDSLQNATWGDADACYLHFDATSGVCDGVKYVSDGRTGYYPTSAKTEIFKANN